MDVCLFRLDFDYLNDLPVLVLDVDDDFKNDRIRQEVIIDKVPFALVFLLSSAAGCHLTQSLFSPAGQRVPHNAVELHPPITASCEVS